MEVEREIKRKRFDEEEEEEGRKTRGGEAV